MAKHGQPSRELSGMDCVEYRYSISETRGVDFTGMLIDLPNVRAGDVVLACMAAVHNPTGETLNLTEWKAGG